MKKVKNDQKNYITRESLVSPKRSSSKKLARTRKSLNYKEEGNFLGYMRRVSSSTLEKKM